MAKDNGSPNTRIEAAKCPPSPSGKHHWMIPMIGLHPVGLCKYCGEDRTFHNNKAEIWDYGERHKQAYRVEVGDSSKAQATESLQSYYPESKKL
ncbi:hypothetical protein LCGC14_2948700 [marine sediment metagenome]|uniref:Uncharacterized protein n=1 Tax=marine sediment metagenome TaxID=412755 RepID=A0A0F9A736_9ZZZZ